MIKFIQFYRDAWSSWGYAVSAAEILSFYTTFPIKTKISLIHMRLHVCNTHIHTQAHTLQQINDILRIKFSEF